MTRTTRGNHAGLLSVDLLRAAAALSVFVYHYGVGRVLAERTGIAAFGWLGWAGATVAVPLFFVLSGFCIHGAERRQLQRSSGLDTAQYLQRRFWRIYPVYVAALVFSIAVNAAAGQSTTGGDFWTHLLMLHGFSAAFFSSINIVLWTIAVECCLYVIYPFWFAFRGAYGLVAASALGFGVSAVSCAVTAWVAYPYSLPARWFFLNSWAPWIGGAALVEWRSREDRGPARWWWAAGIAAWTGMFVLRALGAFDGRWTILEFPLWGIVCVWPVHAAVAMESSFRRAPAVLRPAITLAATIGAASYSLYLLHVPLETLRNVVTGSIPAGAGRTVFAALWFLVTLAAAWVSYRLIERPFMNRRALTHAPESAAVARDDRTAQRLDRAVLTLAVGKDLYFEMACNLARSFLWWHRASDIKFVLATDSRRSMPSDLNGVRVIRLEPGQYGRGFSPKLHMDKLSPAAETLFVDADCLCAANLESVFDRFGAWDVSVIGREETDGEFFGDIATRCRTVGLPWVPRFVGGIYYFKRNAASAEVFRTARELETRYDDLGLLRLRGMPNEEPLIGMAMALADQHPIPEDGTIKAEPMFFSGRTELDVLRGTARLFNVPGRARPYLHWRLPEESRPLIVHFNDSFAEHPPYTTEAMKLEKVMRKGWPVSAASLYAWTRCTLPFVVVKEIKDTLRPYYHALFGPLPVKRSARL